MAQNKMRKAVRLLMTVMMFGLMTVGVFADTFEPSDLNVGSAPYQGAYDGKAHGITVTVYAPKEGATISYSESENGPYTSQEILKTDVGQYTVYYKAEANGQTVYGSNEISIQKAKNNINLFVKSWRYGEPKSEPVVSADFGTPEVLYSASQNGPFGTYDEVVDGKVGTWYAKATVPESTNYKEGVSDTAKFIIAKSNQLVYSSAGYEGVYDEKEHGISVEVDDSTCTISYNAGKGWVSESPMFTDAGEYDVKYKIESPNYETVQGVQKVKIEKAENEVSVVPENLVYGSKIRMAASATNDLDKLELAYSDRKDGGFTKKTPKNAGTWFVRMSIPESKNYKAIEAVASFMISKAELTAEYISEEVIEDAEPKYEIKMSGFMRGETFKTADGFKTPFVEVPSVLEPGTYTLTPQGGEAMNYNFTYKSGVLTVKAQMAKDGSACGKGASYKSADRAITVHKSESDLAGSKFSPLKLMSTEQGKKSIELTWKDKGASYVVYGNRCNADGKKYSLVPINSTTDNSLTVKKINGKKLKKGTYYTFVVVALDENDNVISTSKMIHVVTDGGKKTNCEKVTADKSLKAAVGKTVKIKAKGSKVHRKLAYESSNPNVATVTKSGKVKGVKRGTCKVFVYAANGVSKTIKVRVK